MNVWLALAHEIHPHHAAASLWSSTLGDDATVYFCRFTQLGLLRLLTTPAAMGDDVLTQAQAWDAFDALIANPGNRMLEEPAGIDEPFRRLASSDESSAKVCADAYLAAFAGAASLTLVTFDKALAEKARNAILLG